MTLLRFLTGLLLAGSIDIAFGILFSHLLLKICGHDPADFLFYIHALGVYLGIFITHLLLKSRGSVMRRSFAYALGIVSGIFAAHLTAKICGPVSAPAFTYIWGVSFAIIPDTDALVMGVSSGKMMADHRSWPHWPILIMPITAIIWYFSPSYAVLAGLCLFEHYVHDSVNVGENGEGIRWFAPFDRDYYLISWKKIRNLGIFSRLSGRRLKKIRDKKETMDNWLATHYLHPTASSVAGGVFLALIIVLIAVWR